MSNIHSNRFEILLVEDNPGDVLLLKTCFQRSGLRGNIHVVEDGFEALAFLRREDPYADMLLPDLILLDLNLPRKNGREVLEEVKNDDELKRIPVVILTSSEAEDDVVLTYRLHTNCYIVKPVDFKVFQDTMDIIVSFWFSTVRLPKKAN
ncbi:MAG: response regulator [Phycisphaerae bacterium]|nr:response regulator [Phycisphaerae bacterium]